MNLLGFLLSTMFFSIVPYFATVAHHEYGLSRPQIGYVVAGFPCGYLLASIAGTMLRLHGDSIRTLSRRICFTSLLAAVSGAALGVLPPLMKGASPALLTATLVVCRVVSGFSSGLGDTIILVVLTRVFPSRASEMVSQMEAASGVGALAGPFVGGALYEAGGFTAPPVAFAGVVIVVATVTALSDIEHDAERVPLVHQATGNEEAPATEAAPSVDEKRFSSDTAVKVLCMPFPVAVGAILVSTTLGAYAFVEAIAPLHFHDALGLRPGIVGCVFGSAALCYAACTIVAGKALPLARQHLRLIALPLSMLVMGVGLFFLGSCGAAAHLPFLDPPTLAGQRAAVIAGAFAMVAPMSVAVVVGMASLVDAAMAVDALMANAGGSISNMSLSVAALSGAVVGTHLTEAFGFANAVLCFVALSWLAAFVYVTGTAISMWRSTASSTA